MKSRTLNVKCNAFIRNVGGDETPDYTTEVAHEDDGEDDNAKNSNKINCCGHYDMHMSLCERWS